MSKNVDFSSLTTMGNELSILRGMRRSTEYQQFLLNKLEQMNVSASIKDEMRKSIIRGDYLQSEDYVW